LKKGIQFSEWEKTLRSGNLPSLVAFVGPEIFFYDAGLVRLEAELEKREDQAERIHHWGGETDSLELLTTLNTCPMTVSRRLVGVRRMERVNKKDMSRWTTYCSDPAEWNILLLQITSAKTLTKELEKAIERVGLIVDASTVKAREMTSWASRGIQGRGKRATKEVCSALASKTLGDLIQLRNEIEKIILYVGNKEEVTLEDVRAVGSSLNDSSTFALGDSLAEGDLGSSLLLAHEILRSGEAPAALLASITWHMRRMATIQHLLSIGATDKEIGERTGIPFYFLGKAIQQAKALSPKEVHRRLRALGEWDFRFKRSLAPPSTTVEMWILDLLGMTPSM